MTTQDLFIADLDGPIGTMLLVWDGDGAVRALDFADYRPRLEKLLRRHYGNAVPRPATAPAALTQAIEAYFAGDLSTIDHLPTATNGTEFQCSVWAALRDIPAGTTLSYGVLAARIGKPAAVRAVGLANGANPIGIIVPCHRVIGADGSLTGYGGGIARKHWLLKHEGAPV